MGKLTCNTGGKVKPVKPTTAEEPAPEKPDLPPEKPDPSPASFVVSPSVYCPPSTGPSRLIRPRKKQQCYRRCKVLSGCVLALLGVFLFMGGGWYVRKLHREAKKPPCVYGYEHEGCDREKSERWQKWFEKSLWAMQHRWEEHEGGKGGHRLDSGDDRQRQRPDHVHKEELMQIIGEFRQEMEERYWEMRDGVHPPAPPPPPPPPPM